MKNRLRAEIGFFILAAAICFCGCEKKQNKDETGHFADQSDSEQQEEAAWSEQEDDLSDIWMDEAYDYICTEQETGDPLFATNQPVTILFAGNSLLKTPDTCYYFEKLVNRYQLPVNIERELWDGMNIRFQVSLAESDTDVAEEYRQADIVILQEYGMHYDTTYQDICELIEKYCKKDVVVYYYTTEFDKPFQYLKEISDHEKIHIIDFGKVQQKLNSIPIKEEEEKAAMQETLGRSLYGNDWEQLSKTDKMGIDVTMYDFLHKVNDYHPNELNGFLAAAYIYTQLYKTTFEDYDYEELDDNLKNLLPGLTEETKRDYYREMIKMLNEGISLY